MEAAPSFVPADFEPPLRLETPDFALEPLGPEHNERDYAAWSSSIDHIHATPGFDGRSWPHEMTLGENLGDLEMHARDFAARRGFTYAVLERVGGDVIGCVYIYPVGAPDADALSDPRRHDASVRSWVRADRAHLDARLWEAVARWLRTEWPFELVRYAPRAGEPPLATRP